MKRKFQTGDIVEILNLSHQQIEAIKSQRCNFNIDPAKECVGSRFEVEVVEYGGDNFQIVLLGWNKGGFVERSFKEGQLTLHSRPSKNIFKRIFGP